MNTHKKWKWLYWDRNKLITLFRDKLNLWKTALMSDQRK